MKSRLLLTLALGLVSCTTTQRLEEGGDLWSLDEDTVVLRETRLQDLEERLLETWSGPRSTPGIYVRSIDGQAVALHAAEFRLAPGDHEVVAVGTVRMDGRVVNLDARSLSFQADPGGEYELRGELTGVGRSYIVLVWDLLEEREVARSR